MEAMNQILKNECILGLMISAGKPLDLLSHARCLRVSLLPRDGLPGTGWRNV